MGVVTERIEGFIRDDILTLNCKGYLPVNPKYILDGAWHRRTTVVTASMVDDKTISDVRRISSIHYPIHRVPSMERDAALRN